MQDQGVNPYLVLYLLYGGAPVWCKRLLGVTFFYVDHCLRCRLAAGCSREELAEA